MSRQDWRWFGNAGHFICAQWCRFHLTTQVGPWLVSTVGEYVHPRHGGGSERGESEWLAKNWPGEDIGYGRKYETMVFRAGDGCSSEGCGCGLPSIDGSELECRGYMTAKDAIAGHMAACEEWSKVDPSERAS